MKFETTASPASRSEAGRRLQSRRRCTPGASGFPTSPEPGGGVSRFVLIGPPSGERQAKVAVHRVREVHDELAVLGSDGELIPGERARGGTRDVAPVPVVLRSVAGAEEPVREPDRLSVDGLRL